ncbi:hypothetical protein [Streptomyces sp. NPDC056525]|uniref:hypothetical protein n=1 Tax=Streptomyces sp. NPDC056525 TaxID=3345852 RepID=UPI003678AF04
MTSQDFHGHAVDYDLYRRLVAERDGAPAIPACDRGPAPCRSREPDPDAARHRAELEAVIHTRTGSRAA